ncbi:MAG TPA: thioether cross-link-forming SCIFF peptide maturase [Firmicutes bacterium]|nr:thioether cross-link-forming SCIFF peptide maturase [Bacillota bacterium]
MLHAYELNGYRIAVDANSGSIHVLDDLAWEILKDEKERLPPLAETKEKLGSMFPGDEINAAFAEVKRLEEEGLLFSKERHLTAALRAEKENPSLKALCLHVSHDCNLRCAYCFAAKGDYRSGRTLMGKEVALKAADYLVENSGGRKNIEIDFFGGEPLLNYEVIKAVVAYGRQLEKTTGKHFYFTVTTNGTLLDREKIDFLNEEMDNIVISIDGRREVHDRMRRYPGGEGSYAGIVEAALELVAARKGKSHFIRGTFTAENKDFAKDVFHLADLGFQEISVEPVVGSGKAFHLTEADIPLLLQEYENLALQYLERLEKGQDFRFYHFNIDIYNSPCLYKKIAACGAGSEYLAVSPAGELYPCHQFVGLAEFRLGDLKNGLNNRRLSEKFLASNILSKKKCRDCWAKLFCSGGCHASAFFSSGSIEEPDEIGCLLQKKRIECTIMIQIALAERKEKKRLLQ